MLLRNRCTIIALLVTAMGVSSMANAALVPVLGGKAYYDPDANLSWTTNADINGPMTWDEANAWAAGLDIGGFKGWRLPNTDPSCNGPNCTGSEIGNLYFNVLGNTAGSFGQMIKTGPFNNVGENIFWTATEAPDTREVWAFDTGGGRQGIALKIDTFNAWAVQTGAVPIPAAVWFLGTGIIGLIGIARRKKA